MLVVGHELCGAMRRQALWSCWIVREVVQRDLILILEVLTYGPSGRKGFAESEWKMSNLQYYCSHTPSHPSRADTSM